ncbi:hypothetical protein CKA32_000292 [Geitlerinema sp. FC II]|nr:hypothetical protein CKA32_000292 [Geitlerinema sp. FC II]
MLNCIKSLLKSRNSFPDIGYKHLPYTPRSEEPDFKSGGNNLEDTHVRGKRLVALTLLMTLAYASDIFHGEFVRRKGVNSYVNRPSEKGRKYPRYSHFYTGNCARAWLHSLTVFAEEAQQFLTERMPPQTSKLSPRSKGYKSYPVCFLAFLSPPQVRALSTP